jgi:hypothetical protein
MDEKVSLEAIALYGDNYADKVIKGFFSSKEKITGKEILSLSDIPQINLFVIRELFKAWKEETRKQKSAYFDYDNKEVREALEVYMGVLSNHISIDKSHFAPLLKKAVSQTLMLIFAPYDFFSMIVSGKSNKLEVAPFREEIKYLKINREPLERMLKKVEGQRVDEIPGNEAFGILDQILEEVNFNPEDLDEYIQKFSAITPLDPGKFYISKQKEAVQDVRKTMPLPPTEQKAEREKEKEKVLNETKPHHPTLNEKLNTPRPAVSDHLRKIAKIKDSLTINQKFMFTKVLFYGDFESFSRAIDDIDQLPDINSAMQYLERHTMTWDRDSREFHEFMEMVEKRFS